jgi:hypothetical protein
MDGAAGESLKWNTPVSDLGARGYVFMMPGNDLLSHGICHTIIGAEQFHF